MNKIAIVTDSTSDLTRQTATEQGVTVVPLSVIHKDKTYLDGVDITPGTFYPMLKAATDLPTTSQPSPMRFQKAYEQVLESAEEIVSIHISGELSATAASARIAADTVGKGRVHIVDSGFVSYALALQVLEAVRLVKAGATASDVVKRLARLKDRMQLTFTLDTLHYLQKGGRIGKVSALLGTVLGIKPVIRIEEGHLVPAGKARSTKRALSSVVDLLSKKYGQEKVIIAAGHSAAPEFAEMLQEMASAQLNVEGPVLPFEIGPVVGVHAGPGAAGIAVMPVEY